MCDIHKIKRSSAYKVLETGLGSNVVRNVGQQPVRLRLEQPYAVCHCRKDVDHHHMTPIGRGTVRRSAD